MSSYAISPILNKNRVFILQKSEMEKRLDPAFYYEIINNKFEFRHPTKTISRIVKSFSGGTPDKSTPNYWNGEICWASPKDMKDFYLSDTEDKITEEGLNNSAATIAPIGSVLIVFRSGILQHTLPVSITTTKTAINQDLKILIPSEEVIPEYLAVFLKTFEKRILPRIVKHSTTVQSINQEEFNQLSVPIPEIAIQKRIVEINRKSIEQKKQNEAEAEKLLLSIDDYLLKELEINLPEPPENNLKNRMFTTQISVITGNRLDPFFNQKYFDNLKYPKSRYPVKRVKEINEEIKTGLPIRKDYRIDNGAYPYYGANGIIGYMDEYTHDGLYLVIGQDGYIGNHYVVEGKFWGSNHNWVLKLKDGYDYRYVKAALDLLKYDYLITGGVIPKLTKEALESIRIPVPPIEKQKEIAKHITSVEKEAQRLKDKTKEVLANASKEIEIILVGNG
jgi:restriction endonuclease S subunit